MQCRDDVVVLFSVTIVFHESSLQHLFHDRNGHISVRNDTHAMLLVSLRCDELTAGLQNVQCHSSVSIRLICDSPDHVIREKGLNISRQFNAYFRLNQKRITL